MHRLAENSELIVESAIANTAGVPKGETRLGGVTVSVKSPVGVDTGGAGRPPPVRIESTTSVTVVERWIDPDVPRTRTE